MADIEILHKVLRRAINPALRLLPSEMTSDDARINLLAIGGQESNYETRAQYGGGPARGFWQFEEGTEASRGGVYGIYLHDASKGPLEYVCQRRQVVFDPHEIWETLEFDDVLGAACARLLMWTDPYAVPTEEGEAWTMYCDRCWRPGKPHPDTWPGHWDSANTGMDSFVAPSRTFKFANLPPRSTV